jgi:putative ABC transport system substrate-binding protein
MASVSNPVERGLVASLARPGGTVTGVTHNPGPGFVSKQLEMLKDAAPQITRVGVFWDSTLVTEMGEIHTTAQALGMTVLSADVPDQEPGKFDPAFATLTQERADALYVFPIYREVHGKRIVEFANAHRLPTMFGDRRFVEAGGLMSYFTDWLNLRRRAAAYVDKILKGAKPGELPVERPMQFELVINLKTAQALGLTIPPSILFQADKVIR